MTSFAWPCDPWLPEAPDDKLAEGDGQAHHLSMMLGGLVSPQTQGPAGQGVQAIQAWQPKPVQFSRSSQWSNALVREILSQPGRV